MKSQNRCDRILIIISFFLMSFCLLSCNPLDSTVSGYPLLCDGVLKNNRCSGMLIPLNRTSYKVSEKRQEIIYWTPGIYEEPRRLVNCIVKDKENWVGEYPDGSGKVIMTNGKISDTDSDPKTFYVSKWRWWYANLFQKDMPHYLKILLD